MWLLGIAAIIIAAAVIINFLVKWLNKRRKKSLLTDKKEMEHDRALETQYEQEQKAKHHQ
ncbi:hypothetical protein GCM10027566_36300 [Arachidicoccus ginsenosidivorans]|uniref:DUF2897 family protein n=1 Tax=Arachidicoccus ginsenosidivorans TaxID=496057 RepID=A0A5B8VKF4_9BACT|nr:hypothetical protein [Arachidicoccus ginsenosidivorans]QEC71809.1 hypothetical protein FSB73_09155 [Arachidicoccus ginsenosidivorans]